MNRLQILRRHDVFVVDVQLITGFKVGDRITPAAYLRTCAAVGA